MRTTRQFTVAIITLVSTGFLGLSLAAEPEKQADPHTIVRGRVLLPGGKPAAGAEVALTLTLLAVAHGGQDNRGRQAMVAQRASATCDADGKFSYQATQVAIQALATVNFPGALPSKAAYRLIPGEVDNVLQLIVGTRVVGRVLRDGKSVGGVPVIVAAISPRNSPADQHQAVTDDDGKFAIEQLYPGEEYCVFLPMQPLANKSLAAIKQHFRSAPDGQVTELAEINLHPANIVRGRLLMVGEQPLPSRLTVTISRAEFDDEQRTRVEKDGTFVFCGVPRGAVSLWVTVADGGRTGVYKLSPKNRSLNPLQVTDLCGRVDENLDLVVLLDTGTVPVRNPRQVLRPTVQARQVLVQVNGQPQLRQVLPNATANPALAQQLLLQSEPLCGVTDLRDIEAKPVARSVRSVD